ncbi:DUF6048 family protein [Zunongwangia sp. HGR-M22]|uniref:DUF6048 family protein n=1 Tax=Zunongwangia sp. HGR-M22 TaxID=3015168 RepID=UPI0022DD4B69|nr:DUF6048 family protein [Zunongwangia sp. HGR-M22]WBL24489.1 DUF6048 family protein [Zunongwangia sp. HGR-M22]
MLFLNLNLFAQEDLDSESINPETPTDTTYREKYGLRVGIDISKLARTFFEDDYTGFLIEGDMRVYKNYYAAAEIGNETLPFNEDEIEVSASGSFIKLGVNYNAYENWAGMENIVFAGLRYGFSTFSQEIEQYRIYTRNNYFEDDIRRDREETTGLTAGWIELMAGFKVEVLNNLFLSANVQLKSRLNESKPSGFDNLTIPGFGRTYDDSKFGIGYGYSISYLIPIFRKAKN